MSDAEQSFLDQAAENARKFGPLLMTLRLVILALIAGTAMVVGIYYKTVGMIENNARDTAANTADISSIRQLVLAETTNRVNAVAQIESERQSDLDRRNSRWLYIQRALTLILDREHISHAELGDAN